MTGEEGSLDPEDWRETRALGHRMLDEMLDHLAGIRGKPVWQPMPDDIRAGFRAPAPETGESLGAIYEDFRETILPYPTGNVHPGFMGWVHGGGTAAGMLAEMLAAGLNANLGGRDHAPIAVERQVAAWMADLFGFPPAASGLFVTGSSMANLMAVLVARTQVLGDKARRQGIGEDGARLRAYASAGSHGCVAQAMDLCGFGRDALRLIPVDDRHRMDIDALCGAIAADQASGLVPFLVVGTAGTVDTGAIDDLSAIAGVCGHERLWFHVDGAFGALAMLSSKLAPLLAGIERADSIALDFHKLGQAPYDAGFLLVRDGEKHRAAFAAPAAYLRRETRGLAAGSPWPCDYGPDLSRGFRALKVWVTLRLYGMKRLGAMIEGRCLLAGHLRDRVLAEPALELLAPVALNVVCFRFRHARADEVNAAIVIDLQEAGIAAPSTTILDGKLAIRCAIVNHRTEAADIDRMLAGVLAFGRRHGAA